MQTALLALCEWIKKKWRLLSFLEHKIVVRQLTTKQMSEYNCTVIYCRNIPTELQVGAGSTVAAAPQVADRK